MDQIEDKDPFGLARLDDPEFEARERARLTVSDNDEVPSPEIQKSFVDFLKEFQLKGVKDDELAIRPENLFFACLVNKGSDEFSQRYHYKKPTKNYFSTDDQQATLSLTKRPNGKSYVQIGKYGEGPSFSGQQKESLGISFSPPMFEFREDVDFDRIRLRANFGGRELGVFYGEYGNLSTLLHRDKDNSSDFFASKVDDRRDIDISTLIENGEVTFESGHNSFKASYDKEKDIVKLERFVGKELKDTITIPQHIDGKQKFDELLPGPLLDNLLGADPEEDRTWKDVTLSSFGITWDMPTPIPTS